MLRPISLLFALTAASPLALAGTLFVDAELTTGLGDGSSWDNAFQGIDGLQAALGVAVAGDEVYVAEGLYRPSPSGQRGLSFRLRPGIEIFGGFLGGEASPAERPPFGMAPTLLTGDLAGDDGAGSFGDNSFHVVRTNAGANETSILDGFEVRSGNANGGGNNNDRGAGVLCLGNVSPVIRNCRFVDHRSSFGGAAGYCSTGAAPAFLNCTFENGDGGVFGGAFDIAGGGPVRFDRCGFFGNTADRAGALEIFATSGIVVSNCVFTGNVATGTGGGGAIWVGSGGNTRFRNCTVIGNSSTANAAAGLRNQGANQTTVESSIFWNNSGPGGAQGATNQVNGLANVSYTIVQGGQAGTGNLNVDPNLVDVIGGNFAPAAGSPCIDAGNNAGAAPDAPLDFTGAPRLVDDPATADTGAGTAPIVDLGAVEFGVDVFTVVPGCFANPVALTGGAVGPQVGQAFDIASSSPLGGSGLALFFLGTDGTDLAGCGLLLPGFGEVLLDLVPAPFNLGTVAMAGGQAALSIPLPTQPALAGQTLAMQAASVTTSLPGPPIELSNLLTAIVAP